MPYSLRPVAGLKSARIPGVAALAAVAALPGEPRKQPASTIIEPDHVPVLNSVAWLLATNPDTLCETAPGGRTGGTRGAAIGQKLTRPSSTLWQPFMRKWATSPRPWKSAIATWRWRSGRTTAD
jgi:hypothetical protein